MSYNYNYPAGAGLDSKTTLWMGELDPWMDENYVRQLWYSMGEQVSVKMIRDKFTGASAGYCFIDFVSPQAANKALTNLNSTLIPNTHKLFKLNWASGGGMNERAMGREAGPEFSIFVGDLGPEVSEYMLLSLFQSRYISCKSAKIMTDPNTGMSRGYGFVRFSDESEQQRALVEMQGVYCGNRPMRISMATPKNKTGGGSMPNPMAAGMGMMGAGMGGPGGYYTQPPQPPMTQLNQFSDPNNTTVFVGGLSGLSHEDELRQFFAPFGEITYVKIPPGKGCGFVQYVHRQSAEMAIAQMNGAQIGNSRVRLSWGRSQNDKPMGYRSPQPAMGFNGMGSASPYSAYPSVPHHNYIHHGIPSAVIHHPQIVDPLEPMPIDRMNENFINSKEGLADRMEADGSSWRAIYA